MTFLPRIAPTSASSVERSEHGPGAPHGGPIHGHGGGEESPHESAAPVASHAGPDAEQLEEAATADAPEIAHGMSAKGSGKRPGRGRADGSPSFAAELARNVMSAPPTDHDATVSAGADLPADEDPSESAPFEGDDHGADPHSPAAGPLFPRVVGQQTAEVGAGPSRTAPISDHADLPRVVVNGSTETPNTDAMPVSPRLHAGEHVHMDVGAASRSPVAEHAAPEPALIAQLTAAVERDGAGEQQVGASMVGHAERDGNRPAPADSTQSTSPSVPITGAEIELRAPSPDVSPDRRLPASDVTASRQPLTAPDREDHPPAARGAQTHAASSEAPSSVPLSSGAPPLHPPSPRALSSDLPSRHALSSDVPSWHALSSDGPSPRAPSSDEPPPHTLSSVVPSPRALSSEVPPPGVPSPEALVPHTPAAEVLARDASPSFEAPGTPAWDGRSLNRRPGGPAVSPKDGNAGFAAAVPPARASAPPFSANGAVKVGPEHAATPAPPAGVTAGAGVPRARPLVGPPFSPSFARAGAAYAQVVADGEPAPKSVRTPGVPARAPLPQPAPEPPSFLASPAPSHAGDHGATVVPSQAPSAPRAGQRTPARDEGARSERASVRAEAAALHSAAAAAVPAPSVSRAGDLAPPVAAIGASPAPSTSGPRGVVAGARQPDRRPASPPFAQTTDRTEASPSAPVEAPPRHADPGHPTLPPTPAAPTQGEQAVPAPSPPSFASPEPAAPPPARRGGPRRDVAAVPIQAPASPPAAIVSASAPPAGTQVAPAGLRAGEISSRPAPLTSRPASPAIQLDPSAPIPAGSGVTATGESTAAHPTPLVDPSSANPSLFRLSDTRRVQAAHLDLAQQSYQPGTVATSSPSTKGFGTRPGADKAGTQKKSRPTTFTPIAPPPAPAPGQPPALRAEDPVPPRAGVSGPRSARPVDAIHALASTGAGPAEAAPTLPALARAPQDRAGVTAPERRDERAPFAGPAPIATREVGSSADRNAPRPAEVPRPDTPLADTRPARHERPPLVAADKAPPQALAHAQPLGTAAPHVPGAPAAAPQGPLAAQPLYEMATVDQSLHATALGQNAHLHLDAGAAGPLSLHLTVRDGVADLEVEGPAAERLKLHPEELRRALAGEGLALGHFASRVNETSNTQAQQDGGSPRGQGDQGQGNQQQSTGDQRHATSDRTNQADTAPRPTATSFAAQSGASSYGGEGRRHWQGETPDSPDRDRRPGASSPSGATPSSSGDAATGRRRGVHVTA